jgi:uncharacterized LabA/DUF88 family protein
MSSGKYIDLKRDKMSTDSKIALLIDADNTTHKLLKEILSEAGKYGKVTVRRAYGDFTSEHLKNWKEGLNSFAIRPMQKFAYTIGKNSTDSAMIIDAMDIMHAGTVSGFCIVSSDSDYTGLATRIREQGVFVMGIGKSTTPEAFQKACEIFVFTENLVLTGAADLKAAHTGPLHKHSEVAVSAGKTQKVKGRTDIKKVISKIDKRPINAEMLDRAVEMAMGETGLAHMADVGAKLKTLDPSFDARTYGFPNISALFKSLSQKYELIYKNEGKSLYIKSKSLEL